MNTNETLQRLIENAGHTLNKINHQLRTEYSTGRSPTVASSISDAFARIEKLAKYLSVGLPDVMLAIRSAADAHGAAARAYEQAKREEEQYWLKKTPHR